MFCCFPICAQEATNKKNRTRLWRVFFISTKRDIWRKTEIIKEIDRLCHQKCQIRGLGILILVPIGGILSIVLSNTVLQITGEGGNKSTCAFEKLKAFIPCQLPLHGKTQKHLCFWKSLRHLFFSYSCLKIRTLKTKQWISKRELFFWRGSFPHFELSQFDSSNCMSILRNIYFRANKPIV